MTAIYTNVTNTAPELGCKPTCANTHYRVQGTEGYALNVVSSVMPNREFWMSPTWEFLIKIESSKIEEFREYEIYDFNGIVASVGGSIGLFVGFSFLDCLLALLNRAQFYFANRTKQGIGEGVWGKTDEKSKRWWRL